MRLSSLACAARLGGARDSGVTLAIRPARGHSGAMLLYKIFRAPEWEEMRATGESAGAPVDLADGYIHLSTAAQVSGTAAKHFAGQAGLVLVAVRTEALGGDLRWEPSRGGDLFPHLYRPVRMADVRWAKELPLGSQGHLFPEDVI